jgi:hypothetical protein
LYHRVKSAVPADGDNIAPGGWQERGEDQAGAVICAAAGQLRGRLVVRRIERDAIIQDQSYAAVGQKVVSM